MLFEARNMQSFKHNSPVFGDFPAKTYHHRPLTNVNGEIDVIILVQIEYSYGGIFVPLKGRYQNVRKSDPTFPIPLLIKTKRFSSNLKEVQIIL